MAQKNMICITCPRGCHLSVDTQTGAVTGNSCEKGAEYGKNELFHPMRVLTTTVRLEGKTGSRLPVKTAGPIPKELLFKAMEEANSRIVHSPVHTGDVILENIAGSGVALVACKEM